MLKNIYFFEVGAPMGAEIEIFSLLKKKQNGKVKKLVKQAQYAR